MARPYRIEDENCLYHITNRGDGRRNIYQSESDHLKFLDYLLEAKEKYQFYVYAYVLMSNHYHLLIKTLQSNLSKIMHYINSSYTKYSNIKRNKVGHLFQGRYKSIVVDEDSYFLELTRYIHLNPVRAKIVEKPEEYKWSSYAGYIGKENDIYIDQKEVEKILGMTGGGYQRFVMSEIGRKKDPTRDIYGGMILGSPDFIKDRLRELRERVEGKDYSNKRKMKGYVKKEEILELVKKKYGISTEDLKIRRRRNKGRDAGIYLMRCLTGLTNREIGEVFCMKFSAVSKAAIGFEKEMEKNRGVRKEIEGLISNFEA
jgi:putative transposase